MKHHGYIDEVGAGYVRSLRPRASGYLCQPMKPENKIVNRRLSELKSYNGHAEFGLWPRT
jgi:hypothetical protein